MISIGPQNELEKSCFLQKLAYSKPYSKSAEIESLQQILNILVACVYVNLSRPRMLL